MKFFSASIGQIFFFAFFTASTESDSFFFSPGFFALFWGSDRFFKKNFPFFSPGFLPARYFFAKIRSAISFFSPLLFPFYRNRFFFVFRRVRRNQIYSVYFFLLLFRYFGNRKFFSLFFLFWRTMEALFIFIFIIVENSWKWIGELKFPADHLPTSYLHARRVKE